MWYFGVDQAFDVDSDDEVTETKPDQATLRILRIGNIANNARLARQHTENGAAEEQCSPLPEEIMSQPTRDGSDSPRTSPCWTFLTDSGSTTFGTPSVPVSRRRLSARRENT